jgi:hypothetical protein
VPEAIYSDVTITVEFKRILSTTHTTDEGRFPAEATAAREALNLLTIGGNGAVTNVLVERTR